MDLDEAAAINMVFNDLVEAEEDAVEGHRHYYKRINPFVETNEEQFIALFRLNKQLAQRLIEMLTPFMEEGQTNNSLDIRTKVSRLFETQKHLNNDDNLKGTFFVLYRFLLHYCFMPMVVTKR